MILVRCRVISLDEVTKPFRIIMKIFILLISCHINPMSLFQKLPCLVEAVVETEEIMLPG